MEEEAEWRPPISSASQGVGIPSTALSVPGDASYTSGQGSPFRLQGEAGFLHLPCSRTPRRPQEAGFKGSPFLKWTRPPFRFRFTSS